MNVLDLLRSTGSIVINKQLAHEIGLEAAVVYSELVSLYQYWSNRGELVDDNKEKTNQAKWFFVTIENLEENTCLKRFRQDKAIKYLKEIGLIDTKQMGIPKKRYFSITEKINDFISTHKNAGNQHNGNDRGLEENSKGNPRHSQSVGNQHNGMLDNNTLEGLSQTTNNTLINNNKLNKDSLVNKDNVDNELDNFSFALTPKEQDQVDELEKEYRLKGLSKEVVARVREEVDTKREYLKSYVAYYRTCLENTLHKHHRKHGHIHLPYPHLEESHPLNYGWLNE